MRTLFKIAAASGVHTVSLTDLTLSEAVAACGARAVLTDARFAEALAEAPGGPIAMEAVEKEKTLVRAAQVIEDLRRRGVSRGDLLATVGGGIVQDVGCFAASVYMRGLDWVYLPTTLLAMVDSCIGGKSSINVGSFKNLAGTFFPPQAVILAPSVLTTLSNTDVVSGLCEAAKITYARSDADFRRHQELFERFSIDRPDAVGELVAHTLQCKKWFIEIDEFDRAERLLLNFGHSFGHALESATCHGLAHGVAVGVGMLSAIQTGAKITSDHLLNTAALESHVMSLVKRVDNLDDVLAEVTSDAFFTFFDGDKKHSAAYYRLILVGSDGRLTSQNLERNAAGRERIWNGFQRARDAIVQGV